MTDTWEARAVAAEARVAELEAMVQKMFFKQTEAELETCHLRAAITALADEWEAEADRYDEQIAEGASTTNWRRTYKNIAMNLRKDAAELRALLSTHPSEPPLSPQHEAD